MYKGMLLAVLSRFQVILQGVKKIEAETGTGKVRFYGASFPGREEGIRSKSVRNVGTSTTVFATAERTRRKFLLVRLKTSST